MSQSGAAAPLVHAPPPDPKGWEEVRLVARTMGIGACGGAVFAYLGTPLPWMLGALFTTMIASMSGVRLHMNPLWRRLWIIVLGLTLGSSFGPEVFDHLVEWSVSFIGMMAFVVFGTWLSYQIFVHLGRIDRTTAFFCSSPGGLGEMIILGPMLGGDERTIVLTHAMRIVTVMAIIPPAYTILAGYVPPPSMGGSGFIWESNGRDLLIFLVVGASSAFVGYLIRFPAWQLTCPMLASAAIHIWGVTDARPPSDMIAIAQLVMGSGAGARFSGVKPHELVRPALWSGFATMSLLAIAALAALAWRRRPDWTSARSTWLTPPAGLPR